MILTIFFLFYLTRPVYYHSVIYIPKGSFNYTIKTLNKYHIDAGEIDYFVIKLLGYPQSGWVDLKDNKMSKFDFLYRITHNKAATRNITIIPGETTYFVYKLLEKELYLNNLDCKFDEGFLKPDTYKLPIGISKKYLCSYLYKISYNYHKNINETIFGKFIYQKYKRYLIIASLIQKEAADKSEMRLISSVIYNRLKKHMRLQLDGSLNYGKYSHTKVSYKRIRTDFSRFNTYKYKGLPPSAVAIPSKEAIFAAIFPSKTDYLFFYKCGKYHRFTSSYKEHLKNIKECHNKN